MDKKYVLTGKTMDFYGRLLYRIRAVRDFGSIKAGDLGGWIESEENLSHKGCCWIYDDAVVADHARVIDNASVEGKAKILGQALVCGCANVYENASVFNHAQISDTATLLDKAEICGMARVYGSCVVGGDTIVTDHAQVGGKNVILIGKTRLRRDAKIQSADDFIVIGPIGSRNDYTTFVKSPNDDILVFCGCFSGTLEEFKARVRQEYGDDRLAKIYLFFADSAKIKFDILKKD